MSGRARRSLAWRLGLLMGITVVAVLLLVGILVNRVVSDRYETVLTDQQQQRLDDAADILADRIGRQVPNARIQAVVLRVATNLGVAVSVVATDGTVLAAYGRQPDGDTTQYTSPITVDGVPVATLEATLPSRGTDRAFLPLFNVTLIVAGFVSVLGIVLVSTSIAARLTRPLHDVASAARRLEAGDAGARATGGDDLESSELADAFNSMADRLERSEMLRRRAASDIAHDLATPATVLESQLQAMIDGVVPTDLAGLEAARSAAAALGGVVADIDDLARAEAAPLQARPAEVDLADALTEIAQALDGVRRDRHATLTIDVAPDLIAWADPGDLSRALRNVIANALAHSPAGGTVAVVATAAAPVAATGPAATTNESSGTIAVRIADQGAGIGAEDLPHVFERFYRADTARATDPATGRPSGLGLGLTIARELLAASGGRIVVERTGPDGTTFLAEVPQAQRKSIPRT